MLLVKKKQIDRLNERVLSGFIKTEYARLFKIFPKALFTPEHMRQWVTEAKGYGIVRTTDVAQYIEMNIQSAKMQKRPTDKVIFYYLTHPKMTAAEKLEHIKNNFL